MEVHFCAARTHTQTPDPFERIELRVFSVPLRLKPLIAGQLVGGALGRVAHWICDAESAGNAWRASGHRLTLFWDEVQMREEEVDGGAARWPLG